MFRKLKDSLSSLNLQKLQRDAKIEYSRARYRAAKFNSELRDKVDRQLNSPSLQSSWQQAKDYSQKLNPKKLKDVDFAKQLKSADSKWTAARDKVTDGIDYGIRTAAGLFRTAAKKVDVPKAVNSSLQSGKTLWGESKSFFQENRRMAREHIRDYFSANRRLFDYYRRKLFVFSPQFRRKILFFSCAAVFLYGLGSAIPYAVVKYQIEKQRLQLEKEQVSQEKKEAPQELPPPQFVPAGVPSQPSSGFLYDSEGFIKPPGDSYR